LRCKRYCSTLRTELLWGSMSRFVVAALILSGFWLALSGHYTVFLLLSGMGCVLLTLVFVHRINIIDREYPHHLLIGIFRYVPWLLFEILKSAWNIGKIILNPKLPISPTLVRIKTTQRTPLGQVIYANSITLTPGTISLELTEGKILVHALTDDGAAGVLSGDMDRRVTRFEGGR